MAEEDLLEIKEKAFQAYIRPLETVTSIKYLGRVLTVADENWLEVVGNLRNVRKSWACLARILWWEGAIPRLFGMLFKVVVHAVMILGLKMRVMTPHMRRPLGSSQHGVARRIMGRKPAILEERLWE